MKKNSVACKRTRKCDHGLAYFLNGASIMAKHNKDEQPLTKNPFNIVLIDGLIKYQFIYCMQCGVKLDAKDN